ncbi:helix-turn-helix domain-containing protein [Streptomyces sp. BH-SS-21]|uniref:Helix-turn-helix domain-containing protein n=1 Tax=Streptomyces liliiviolaceus TaxID=2823109 RepID=A0A940Y142_9ACTN|nr:helix-turn-helix domain-containing protein [Streptomyces liliiviolaceus]
MKEHGSTHGGRETEVECQYLRVDEAASYLGMSRRWMYRESQRHGLPRYYFGGKLRFRVGDLDSWARQQKMS